MNKYLTLSHQNRRDGIVLAKMLAPVLFLVCIGSYFHTFVVNAVEANLAINMGIIGTASYGVVLIVIRLLSAMVDFRVIERFGHEAGQGIYMKTLLEEPWVKRRYVRHYLSHIANTGGTLSSQMDQTAIESELHALQGEFDSKLEFPQFLVGFMIAMGLLGTFIGLLETLTGISGMLDGMGGSGSDMSQQFMKLVVELRKPLAGMGIAFSASMFGLITSLMLAVMMTNLRRYISRVVSLARNVMHELTEMTRSTSGAKDSSKHLSPEDIARLAGEKEEATPIPASGMVSNRLVAERFDLLTKKIDRLLETIETSVVNTQKTNDLLGFGPRMKEISEKTLEEIKVLAMRQVEDQTLMKSLIDLNVDAMRVSNASLEAQRQTKDFSSECVGILKNLTLGMAEQHTISRQIMEVDSSIFRSIGGIVGAQNQAADSRDQLLGEIRSLIAAQTEQKALVQNLVDHSGTANRVAEGALEAQRQVRAELVSMLQNMLDKLAKSEEVGIGNGRHLWEIKENFIKLCKSFGMLDIIASGMSGHGLLLETLIEEARGAQRTLEAMKEDIHLQVLKGD